MDKTQPAASAASHRDLNVYDQEAQLEKNERRMELVASTFAIFLRILTFLLQIAITASAARCLEQYYQAADPSLWVDNTTTYPTILNLVAALVIVLFNGVALCAYVGGKRAVEKWLAYEGLANIIQTTLCTLASGVMLGTAPSPNSIEGQACNGPQQNAAGMNTVCNLQNFIQYTMLVQSWMGTVIYAWGVVVERQRKKLFKQKLEKRNTSATIAEADSGGKE